MDIKAWIAAVLLGGGLAMGQAQPAPTAALRGILAETPLPASMPAQGIVALVADFATLRTALGRPLERGDVAARAGYVGASPALQAYARDPDGHAWQRLAGVAMDGIQWMALAPAALGAQPGDGLFLWGLASDAAAQDVLARLQREQGFAPHGDAGDLWANGELPRPGRDLVAAREQMANPWRVATGQVPTVVGRRGAALLQSRRPELVRAALAPAGPRVTGLPWVPATLEAVDASLPEARVTQAMVFSTRAGFELDLIDPAVLLGPAAMDRERLRSELEAAQQAMAQGVPAYPGGMLLDATVGDEQVVVVALAYPHCAPAEAALLPLQNRWMADFERVTASVDGQAVPSGDACVAVLTATARPEVVGFGGFALQRFQQRKLQVLQIQTGKAP